MSDESTANLAPVENVAPNGAVPEPSTAPEDAPVEEITTTPARPFTLAIDVGGTGLKAAVLDAKDRLVADRVRIPTTYPLPPKEFLEAIEKLCQPLPSPDRIAMGFPGVVRNGVILTAPHFVTAKGPGTKVVPSLLEQWTNFPMEKELTERLGKATKIWNDADLQGLAVIAGHGLEFVVTLGTAVGTALFLDGKVMPHLEFVHTPFRNNQTYSEQLGDAELSRIGRKRWRKRVLLALDTFKALINYDHCFIGGGNARVLKGVIEDDSVSLVDNFAGLFGGVKLWDQTS